MNSIELLVDTLLLSALLGLNSSKLLRFISVREFLLKNAGTLGFFYFESSPYFFTFLKLISFSDPKFPDSSLLTLLSLDWLASRKLFSTGW